MRRKVNGVESDAATSEPPAEPPDSSGREVYRRGWGGRTQYLRDLVADLDEEPSASDAASARSACAIGIRLAKLAGFSVDTTEYRSGTFSF